MSIERRTFLKASALGAGVALLQACARRDEVQYLVQPLERPEGRPGEGVWKTSVCGQCAAGCGTTVRVVDGDARKVEGLRAHPINHGGLCALGQASLQGHYDPDRVTTPLARAAGGELEPIAWDAALEAAAGAIARAAAADPASIAFVDGGGNTFVRAILARLAHALGAPPPYVLEPAQAQVERRAAQVALGFDAMPAYDLARADYILSIGPAFLDRGHQPAWATWAMGRVRGGTPGRRGKLVQAEARMSNTAAFADEWLPVVPGEEGTLARAIAGVLLAEMPQRGKVGAYRARLTDPEPVLDEAARRCGLPATTIRRIARELAAAERPVVVAGGGAALLPGGLESTIAALALNHLLGAVGREGGVFPSASFAVARALHPEGVAPAGDLAALEDRLRDEGGAAPRVVVVCEGDPVHTRPAARGWRDGLARVETVIALASARDDTAAMAHVVLPVHSDVERFQAIEPEGLAFPVLSLAEPAVKPIGDTRHPGDALLAIAAALDRSAELPWTSFEEMVEQATARGAATLPGGETTDATQLWLDAVERGGIWGEVPLTRAAAEAIGAGEVAVAAASTESVAPTEPGVTRADAADAADSAGATAAGNAADPAPAEATAAVPSDAPSEEIAAAAPEGMTLLLFESPKYGDGRGANKAWLQELPDTLTTVMWSGWAEVAARDAERLGVSTGDLVEIATEHGSIEAPAVVRPEARPGTIALPLGTGHRDYGRYARGRGANPLDLVGAVSVDGTTTPALCGARARVRRAGRAKLALFGRGLRDAEHIPVGWAPMSNGHGHGGGER